jgi:hypothetical protein
MQWVFETLGVSQEASASAIRKAYAKAIKDCDQATELERFQRIRQAYELALQWAAQRESSLATAMPEAPEEIFGPQAPPRPYLWRNPQRIAPLDEPLGDRPVIDAQRPANVVATAFATALHKEGNDAIYELLDQYSEDERLTSLEERTAFEQMVLAMCFATPPNIALLDASGDRFEWEASTWNLTARPDLLDRMRRHFSLRNTLAANKFKDAQEFEEAVRIYRGIQRRPRRSVQPWRILWTNRLLDNYVEFSQELNERYGAQALDWWREKLANNPKLLERGGRKPSKMKIALSQRRDKLRVAWQATPLGRGSLIFALIVLLLILWRLMTFTSANPVN